MKIAIFVVLVLIGGLSTITKVNIFKTQWKNILIELALFVIAIFFISLAITYFHYNIYPLFLN